MKPSTEADLADLKDIFEGLVHKLDKMSTKDKIDLAARIKPIAKACEEVDKAVKDIVKNMLNHKEGSLNGGLFRAKLQLVPIDRLKQKEFKEERPTLYELYVRNDVDERVTYELR